MKKCNKCKELKTLDNFSKDSSRKDGLKYTCRNCADAMHANWIINNNNKVKMHASNSYQKRKNLISQRRKELRLLNPEKYRLNAKKTRMKNLTYYQKKSREAAWKKAGILDMTYDKYLELLKNQNYKCAVCLTHSDDLKRNLAVDHNHSTGVVRGLLCDACNRAIGYLKESESILVSAINYLKKYD
jgi:rubrerythrin